MSLWQRVRNLLRGERRVPPLSTPVPPLMPNDEPEIVVPEISVEELQLALAQPEPPLLLDVREPHEWRLVRLAVARHLPMNDVPAQLDTLSPDQAVVVICAHGSRSYDVAAWLIEQGIHASSLAGGITQWARRGGPVVQGAVE